MKDKFYIKNVDGCWVMDDAHYEKQSGYMYMREEFYRIWRKIENGDSFAFIRWGDGERALAEGRTVVAQENWKASGKTNLGNELLSCLKENDGNVIQAISCPCCDSRSYLWYKKQLNTSNITFSNIWVNGNWQLFKKKFEELHKDAVLIVNQRGRNKKYGKLNVLNAYYVDDNCVEFWDEKGDYFVNRIIQECGKYHDVLFVVSAGPLAAPIIKRLYSHNRNNIYIDFGSAIDYITHDTLTRPYMDEKHKYSKRLCWMPQSDNSLDVDVVLTAYKRPEVLKQQLQAIENQSLAPKRVLLYQDGIDSYYSIKLNDEICSSFDEVYKADQNYGVWKRFEYASEICKSDYICMFDDDTIPGERWLENCYIHTLQNRGVYGTNGVVVCSTNNELHMNNIVSVGWTTCNDDAIRVDYVGHSWFFERVLLKEMLSLKKWCDYKYVGEDMALSFAAQKKQLKTFVPPHPVEDISLWGSLPRYAMNYGASDVAISKSSKNLTAMRDVLANYYKAGFSLLKDSDIFDDIVSSIKDLRREAVEGDLKKIIETNIDVYLYGAGKYALVVEQYLKKLGKEIKGKVVTEKKQNASTDIIDVNEFISLSNKRLIFLALSEVHHSEIMEKFDRAKGITVFPQVDSKYSYSYLISYIKSQVS